MSLAGRGVVLTRPRELAQALAARIARAGGRAFLFPTIEIEPLPQRGPTGAFDIVVFVSPTAVEQGRRWIGAGAQIFAVGAGTRAALAERGAHGAIAPSSRADSEALLELPDLAQVAGKRILIVRGEGGRALLGDTLAARGAQIEYGECYRRRRPHADPAPLLLARAAGELHAVTVSSAEALENLAALLGAGGAALLRETPLFVPHARVAALAARLGVHEVLLAGPSDDAMIERLVAFFSDERKQPRP